MPGAATVTWRTDLELVLDVTAPRARRIWSLRQQMRAYDAANAAAERFDAPLVTVDQRLLSASGAVGIPARHLDDFLLSEASPDGTRSPLRPAAEGDDRRDPVTVSLCR